MILVGFRYFEIHICVSKVIVIENKLVYSLWFDLFVANLKDSLI